MDSSNQSVKRSYDQQDGDGRRGGLDYLQLDSEQVNKARQSLLQVAPSMESPSVSSTMHQSTTFALLLDQLRQQRQQLQRAINNGLHNPFNSQAFGAPQQQQQHLRASTQRVDSTRSTLQAFGSQEPLGMERHNPSDVMQMLVQAAQKQRQQMNSMPMLNSKLSCVTQMNPNQQQQQDMSHLNPDQVTSLLVSLKSQGDLSGAGSSQPYSPSLQIQEKDEPHTKRSATPPLRKCRRLVTPRVKNNSKSNSKKPSKVPSSVPCRCRGMPNDHTPKTAFIVIPKSVIHGEALKCSHPICQKRGVRFRYCEVCQTPVAKRNFSTRHNHPPDEFPETNEEVETKTKLDSKEYEEEGDADMEIKVDEKDEEEATTWWRQPQDTDRCSIASLIAAANQNQTTVSLSGTSKVTSEVSCANATNKDEHQISLNVRNKVASNVLSAGATTNDEHEPEEKHHPKKSKNNMLMARVCDQTPILNPPDILTTFGSKRCREWLALLGQRPPADRPELMSQWLHQLMVISDVSRPALQQVIDQDHDTMISDMAESWSDNGTARSTASSVDRSRSPLERLPSDAKEEYGAWHTSSSECHD